MVLSESFLEPLVAGNQKSSLALFLPSFACSGTCRAPLPGVLLCGLARQAHRGAPLAGVLLSSSVRQAFGGSVYCSAANERERLWWRFHPTMHDSAVSPCFQVCPAFLHRHFPPWSPPSHSLNPSLLTQQQSSPWDCSTIPKLQLPTAVPSRGPVSLSEVCMATARTVCFSFHLGCHRSAVSLSALHVSPLTQIIAPIWGLEPCFSSPTHWGQVQSY